MPCHETQNCALCWGLQKSRALKCDAWGLFRKRLVKGVIGKWRERLTNVIIIICDAIPLVTLTDFRPYCLNWTSVGGVLAAIDGYFRDSLRWPQLCITWSSLRPTMWRDQAHQRSLRLHRCYFRRALSPQFASLWQLACKKKYNEWEFDQWPWSSRYC